MKKINQLSLIVITIITINACKTSAPIADFDESVIMDTIEIDANSKLDIYRASETRINDLLHTKLEVSFDWDSAFLFGKAELQFSPYFYPTDSLTIDAKGFQIHQVGLLDQIGKVSALNYAYDSLLLKIDLNRVYKRDDTFKIFIEYTAMPNKLKEGGSSAITSDKGLYFINHDGSDPDKPKQIWTQGETEASSCWFPTIDSPNEKTTQEIYITVDSIYKTLSNGALIFQTENEDGTRTDFWKQELPHAPYLFMMTVGEFAVVEDEWKGKPVHYYVEPKYETFAKDIYPNTTEMLTFFSEKLNYEYPWDKYHQVIVRDYVSGAMENTGAVIFGDFIQGDDRFLIDNAAEDIVAHELFHHWFGDLVTCESWSNLPLNESFATYGEYLWDEYKYGKDKADYGGLQDMNIYLQQARVNKKKLIRFHYEAREDMFDSHSYQKGGRILHMLRKYVGDEAFFTALSLYLKENEYTAVEIHQLRLAFEKVTGEDLNWFFNQWFLGAGHPVIKVESKYADSNKTYTVSIKQTQEGDGIARAFQLPTKIGIVKANGEMIIKEVFINERNQDFTFPLDQKPAFVNIDIDKVLLAEIDQEIDKKDASVYYEAATNYVDKINALKMLKNNEDSISLNNIESALNHSFWDVRRKAIQYSKKLGEARQNKTYEKLLFMAEKDQKSAVRAAAISALASNFEDKVPSDFLDERLNDRSYVVVSSALEALVEIDEEAGVKAAKKLEEEKNNTIQLTIARVYANEGSPERDAFFQKLLTEVSGFSKYPLLISYSEFVEKQENAVIQTQLSTLKKESMDNDSWFLRMAAVNGVINIKDKFEKEVESLDERIKNEKIETERTSLISQKKDAEDMIDKTIKILKELNDKEENENLKALIESEL